MLIHDPASHLRLHEQRAATAAAHAEHRPGTQRPRADAEPDRVVAALRRRWTQQTGTTVTGADAGRDAGDGGPAADWLASPVLDEPRVLDPAAFRLLHRINTETDDATSTSPALRAAVGVLIGAVVPAADVERLLPRPDEPPVLVATLAAWAIRHADDAAIMLASVVLDLQDIPTSPVATAAAAPRPIAVAG